MSNESVTTAQTCQWRCRNNAEDFRGKEKKEYFNFSKKILALVAIQQQVEMTFVSSLVLSALRKCRKKDGPYGQFQKAVLKAK